ncbi:Transcription Factor E2-Alpha [Manis pentadactyla]|nr:Transcription Factor E2-Alpha [Manis pentadactyla]
MRKRMVPSPRQMQPPLSLAPPGTQTKFLVHTQANSYSGNLEREHRMTTLKPKSLCFSTTDYPFVNYLGNFSGYWISIIGLKYLQNLHLVSLADFGKEIRK